VDLRWRSILTVASLDAEAVPRRHGRGPGAHRGRPRPAQAAETDPRWARPAQTRAAFAQSRACGCGWTTYTPDNARPLARRSRVLEAMLPDRQSGRAA